MTYYVMNDRRRRTILAMLASMTLLPHAAIATPTSLTFRGLEHRHSGDERVSLARRSFGEHIPAGTPLHEARAKLEKAGARCSDGVSLSCTHNSFEGVSDMLRHVVWTVDVSHDQGVVTGLDIQRQSIGS